LRASDADGAIEKLVQRLDGAIDRIVLPKAIEVSTET
jgi:hypothetical protein